MRKRVLSRSFYIVPAIVCLVGLAFLLYYYFFTGFATTSETHYLYVDEDDTVDSVCAKLQPMGSAHAMTALRTLMRHSEYEECVRTGRFAIHPDDGVITIFHRLKNGQQTPLMITIPESRTMPLLAAALSRKLMLDSATIVNALTDSSCCARLGYTPQTIPALFVPNTYEVYWNLSITNLLERMKREHDAFWNSERQQKAQALNLTPDEVCTLASIIDEETAYTPEKPLIAGMYLNRLQAEMPLQADPTVKFAIGDHGMLTTDSPYNTYMYAGLPPGPIKIASIKGIDAVLNRTQHDYLFMCAKEDFSGTHNFAHTFREHQQNAARYARALNRRGIE